MRFSERAAGSVASDLLMVLSFVTSFTINPFQNEMRVQVESRLCENWDGEPSVCFLAGIDRVKRELGQIIRIQSCWSFQRTESTNYRTHLDLATP